jgi:hypothetical protein
MDAGGAGRLAAGHLLATLSPRPVATFEVDALIDHRSRRPPMIFDTDRWVHYEAPELVVHACQDALGVPHYLAQGENPAAAVALLHGITAATGLAFDTAKLEESAEQTRKQIDAQVTASDQVAEAVRDLEAQFDAAAGKNSLPLAGSPTRIPDAEEIAAEFERFLAEQDE